MSSVHGTVEALRPKGGGGIAEVQLGRGLASAGGDQQGEAGEAKQAHVSAR